MDGQTTQHLSDRLLGGLAHRTVSPDGLAQAACHLAACAECRGRLVDLEPRKGRAFLLDAFGDAALAERPREDVCPFSASSLEAVLELGRDLDDVPPERLHLVTGNRRRYREALVVAALLAEARRLWHETPDLAMQRVDAAFATLAALDGTHLPEILLAGLRSRAWAYRANTLRVASKLTEAERALDEAWSWLAKAPREPSVEAELLEWTACIRRDQRRWSEALSALDEAQSLLAGRDGKARQRARITVLRAFFHGEHGQLEESNAILEGLLQQHGCRSLGEPLYLAALQNLAVGYVETGHADKARPMLAQLRGLTDHLGYSLDALRVDWLEARICQAEGNPIGAEGLYRDVRAGFVEEAIPFDTALVSLDLAVLLLEQNRTAEASQLALEIQPTFRELEIERETLTASLVVLEALRRETATADQVRRLARRLRRR